MFSFFNKTDADEYIDLSEQHAALGAGARLGVSYYLVDNDGGIIAEDGYCQNEMMPMASIKKVAIALAVLRGITSTPSIPFVLENTFLFSDDDFSPGLPSNPLDQYFFDANNRHPAQSKTILQLLRLMLIHSDNTATDFLLDLIGGPGVVNELMTEYGMPNYHLNRNCRQLLGDYYGIEPFKSRENCKLMLDELTHHVFDYHESERTMFADEEDCCSPKTSSALLHLLLVSSLGASDDWMTQATSLILQIMTECVTGANRIKKAAANFEATASVGNKTGSLGGIANDTAFIKLKGGRSILLSIYTSLSPLPMAEREKVITQVAEMVIHKLMQIPKPEAKSFLKYDGHF